MILKEAFHYQNYLSNLFVEAINYLHQRDFITTTKETHYRSKVNSESKDEILNPPKPYNVNFCPNDLVDFIVELINEKDKLTNAIVAAKRSVSLDIDAAMSINKTKQDFISALRNMMSVKDVQVEKNGSSYKFNNDGDQVTYFYPVTVVQTIDYNRNNVRKLITKYQKETNDVSVERDRIDITTKVDYTPIWEVDTPLEDILMPE